jgi:hypothetical protein
VFWTATGGHEGVFNGAYRKRPGCVPEVVRDVCPEDVDDHFNYDAIDNAKVKGYEYMDGYRSGSSARKKSLLYPSARSDDLDLWFGTGWAA